MADDAPDHYNDNQRAHALREMQAEAAKIARAKAKADAKAEREAARKAAKDAGLDFTGPAGDEIMKSHGDVDLGLHMAATLGEPGDVVVAENRLWRQTAKLWRMWHDSQLHQRAQKYNGGRAYDRQGDVTRITLSNSNVEGIVKQTKVFLTDPEFFDRAPYGAPFRNAFVRVVGKTVVIEPLEREHRVREDQCPLHDLAPEDAYPLLAITTLEQVFAGYPDMDMIVDFVFDWLGLALVGLAPKFKDTPIFFGPKDAGKSVVLSIIAAAFPAASITSITLHDMEIEHGRAGLANMRLNRVNELPARELLGGEASKAILSGDPVMCRRMRENWFQLISRCAHALACNDLPQSRDPALLGRFAPIPCRNVVPDEKKDRDLVDKLNAEAPLIARYALSRLPAVLARGHLIRPPSSLESSVEWGMESDPVASWAAESVERHTEPLIGSTDLYNNFRSWASANNHRALSSTMFAKRMQAVGFSKHKASTIFWYARWINGAQDRQQSFSPPKSWQD